MNVRSMAVLAFAASAGLVIGSLGSGTVTSAQGQDKSKSNIQPARKDATDSAKTKSVLDFELATRLIAYGRAEKNAECLLMAAQIMHKNPTAQMKSGYVVSGPKGDFKAANPGWVSAKDLVAEAKKMTSSANVDAMAMATDKMLQEATRGAVNGPQVDAFTIGGGQTINWNPVNFRGNEKAVVFIDCGVYARMTLEVIDQNGNVVVRDNVPGNYFTCSWYPSWTGPYTFRLINQDTISFKCGMATN